MNIIKLVKSVFFLLSFTHTCFAVSQKSGQKPQPAHIKLRFGAIYSGDSFATYWAHKQKYFEQEGLDVEFIDFMSAQERDGALVADSVQGMTSDLIGSSLLRKSNMDVRVVALTLGDQPTIRRVGVLANNPKQELTREALKGKTIGISKNTIIEYLTDRMFAKVGIDPDQAGIVKVAVPNIPARLSMLMSKGIDMAVLPEPLASMAEEKGNKVIIGDQGDMFSHAVVTFRSDFIKKHPEAIPAFLRAMNRAIFEINREPEKYRQATAERCRVPDAVKNKFFLYQYAHQKLPSEALYNDVQIWLIHKKYIEKPIPYNDLILIDVANAKQLASS